MIFILCDLKTLSRTLPRIPKWFESMMIWLLESVLVIFISFLAVSLTAVSLTALTYSLLQAEKVK